MTELELTRTPGDRRLYALDGVGTLRLEGVFSRGATAKAGGLGWQLRRRGVLQRVLEAADAAGAVVGRFEGRTWRRGGSLRWSGRELVLQPDSAWRQRYALVEDARKLATIEARGWGRRPVSIAVDDLSAIDPGLLLFAVFVVRALAEDAQATAGAAGGAAVVASG